MISANLLFFLKFYKIDAYVLFVLLLGKEIVVQLLRFRASIFVVVRIITAVVLVIVLAAFLTFNALFFLNQIAHQVVTHYFLTLLLIRVDQIVPQNESFARLQLGKLLKFFNSVQHCDDVSLDIDTHSLEIFLCNLREGLPVDRVVFKQPYIIMQAIIL